MKVLVLSEADYLDALSALQRAHACAALQVNLCDLFHRQNGVRFHSAAYWRMERRRYARLLAIAMQP